MPIRKFLARKVHNLIQEQVLPRVIPPQPEPPGGYSTSATFEYVPLGSPREEIRLLELFPVRPGEPQNVYCKIRHVRLDSNYPYAAVSYTWGPSTEPTFINIGGRPFEVPHSAYEALKGLRSPGGGDPGQGNKTVWIDAVCIDQQNMSEKEQQILAMKEVYERAHHVYVWLHANPGDDPLSAIKFLKFKTGVGGAQYRLGQAEINAFNSFLNHTWFSRTWTFQEVVLPRSISIVYGSSNGNPGNNEVSWETLVTRADGLFNRSSSAQFYTPPPNILKILGSILEIEKARRKADGFNYSLEAALFSTRGRSVTDGRDSVYALMGIAKDVASLNIVPSYKLSIAQVYQDTATRILQNTNSLRLLSAAGLEHNNTDKNPGLPSWVPDWSSTSNLNLLGQRADISSLESIQTHGLPWLSTPSFPDPSILYVKGYILDAPKSLMTPFPTAPLTLASSDAFHLNHGNGVSMLSTPTIHTTGEEFNYAYYMGPWGGRAGVSTLL